MNYSRKLAKAWKALDDKQRLVVSWLEQGKSHHVIYLIMTWNMFPCSMFVQYFLFLTNVLASTLKRRLWSWLFYFRWNTGLELSDNCLCSWQLWSCIFIFTFFPQMQLGASCPDKQETVKKKKTLRMEYQLTEHNIYCIILLFKTSNSKWNQMHYTK